MSEQIRVPDHFDLETDWMGVDFDGTLQERIKGAPIDVLGKPIMPMVERVKAWLELGMKVKILTARVSLVQKDIPYIDQDALYQRIAEQKILLGKWCLDHVGRALPITCEKDCYMYQQWDDRAVCIEHNVGTILGINPIWAPISEQAE